MSGRGTGLDDDDDNNDDNDGDDDDVDNDDDGDDDDDDDDDDGRGASRIANGGPRLSFLTTPREPCDRLLAVGGTPSSRVTRGKPKNASNYDTLPSFLRVDGLGT